MGKRNSKEFYKEITMKRGFKEIVAWQYEGHTAIGVLYDDYCEHYISIAVNYYMDSNIREGDLWYADSIYKDEDTEIRLATKDEIQTLISALDNHRIPYKYDEDTMTIRCYDFYPTIWMKIKKFFKIN